MPVNEIDIYRLLLTDEDGLPRPVGDLFESWVSTLASKDRANSAWDTAARHWLAALRTALTPGYHVVESSHFIIMAWQEDKLGKTLLKFAEASRSTLLSSLHGVAAFPNPGKSVIIIFRTIEEYYQYVAWYFAEGEHSISTGIHLRVGYPHTAMFGTKLLAIENTIAHELTHASLHHLSLPTWLEEGLARLFEHQLTGWSSLALTGEIAQEHKHFWNVNELNEFWCGEGFHRSGDAQRMNHQLAQILVRLLADNARPKWFGLVQSPKRRFLSFVKSARIEDCGNQACLDHYGFDLNQLASQFLGDELWSRDE